MKGRLSLIAVSLVALGLAGCGQDDPAATAPGGGGFANEDAAATPPGAASGATGNRADQNSRDAVPTQQQLDPIPAENKPGGRTEQQP